MESNNENRSERRKEARELYDEKKLLAKERNRERNRRRKTNNLWIWFGVLILIFILVWWLWSIGTFEDITGITNG